MKRCILTGLAMILFLCGCAPAAEYKQGRDTVESYFNGEYQILKSQSYPPETQHLQLKNEKYNVALIEFVDQYKKEKDSVYFSGKRTGKRVYAKLDLKTGHVKFDIKNGTLDELSLLYVDKMVQDGVLEVLPAPPDFETLFPN